MKWWLIAGGAVTAAAALFFAKPWDERRPDEPGSDVAVENPAIRAASGEADDPNVLRVCADPNNLPFSNRAGEGFENKLVEMIAADLGKKVSYTWWAQRRGNVRETLNAGACDLIPGVATSMEMLGTTRPYYRSSYVALTRTGRAIDVKTFDDPRLAELKIGVQLIGDDGSNTPPAHSIARRGHTSNVYGYTVYGDYKQPAPQEEIVKAVADGRIDIGFVWGPVAGYFAKQQRLKMQLLPPFDGPQLPMIYDISVGIRKTETAFRDDIDAVLARRKSDIDALLSAYGVPLIRE